MPVVLEHLCENASPPLTIPPVETGLQYAPGLLLRHLSK